jgi:hypothetical protein
MTIDAKDVSPSLRSLSVRVIRLFVLLLFLLEGVN